MSSQWLDTKYLLMLSGRLRNFKQKTNHLYNMSCPFCGDSKKDKTKARGFVFPKNGKLRFFCHNCNVPGINIPKLIQQVDPGLFDEYLREKIADNPQPRQKTDVEIFADKMKPPKFHSNTPLKALRKISSFKPDSIIKKWVDDRKIPTKYHYKLFFCKEFKAWVNTIIPDKFENTEHDEPRLIIPLLDRDGNLFGFQGRSFKKNAKLRYITIMLDDDMPKLYGLDTYDERLQIYALEGPIDSMFLPNAIASAGSDVTSNLDYISEDKSKFVIVYDNEPRNKEICDKIEKAIEAGYPVCIWPESIKEKDVNDMILAGMKTRKIVETINDNTYTGLEAKLRFQTWKKI